MNSFAFAELAAICPCPDLLIKVMLGPKPSKAEWLDYGKKLVALFYDIHGRDRQAAVSGLGQLFWCVIVLVRLAKKASYDVDESRLGGLCQALVSGLIARRSACPLGDAKAKVDVGTAIRYLHPADAQLIATLVAKVVESAGGLYLHAQSAYRYAKSMIASLPQSTAERAEEQSGIMQMYAEELLEDLLKLQECPVRSAFFDDEAHEMGENRWVFVDPFSFHQEDIAVPLLAVVALGKKDSMIPGKPIAYRTKTETAYKGITTAVGRLSMWTEFYIDVSKEGTMRFDDLGGLTLQDIFRDLKAPGLYEVVKARLLLDLWNFMVPLRLTGSVPRFNRQHSARPVGYADQIDQLPYLLLQTIRRERGGALSDERLKEIREEAAESEGLKKASRKPPTYIKKWWRTQLPPGGKRSPQAQALITAYDLTWVGDGYTLAVRHEKCDDILVKARTRDLSKPPKLV